MKQRFKKTWLWALLPFFMACNTTEIDVHQRLLTSMTVTDAGQQPISGAKVSVYTEGIVPTILLEKPTKTDGTVHLAFFAPAEERAELHFQLQADGFMKHYIWGYTPDNFTHYRLDLGNVKLFRESEVVLLQIKKVHDGSSGNNILSDVRIVGDAVRPEAFEDAVYYIPRHKTSILAYTLKNAAGQQSVREVELTATDQPITYTLAY